jgi:hypothetical protein
MKNWILTFLTLPMFQLAVADSERFTTGDYLFVKAQIIGCDSQIRLVGVGQILDTGQVTLFDSIQLETEGRTPSEVTAQLVNLLEKQTGRRSETIQIKRVSAEDSRTAAQLMMVLYNERSRGCEAEPKPDNFRKAKKWFRIAHKSSHNKAFKYVPGLWPSTGTSSAVPLN